MAHHKRKRPKHRRSGCLLCKPHKLTANVKAQRIGGRHSWIRHEEVASGGPSQQIEARRMNKPTTRATLT